MAHPHIEPVNLTAQELRKRTPAFKGWLTAAGAEILKPTNEYELIRFRTANCTSIIYTNNRGQMSYVGEAWPVLRHYLDGTAWRAAQATPRRSKSPVIVRSIRERDGSLCFFCQLTVERQDESIEHLVPVTAGGPNHISNLFLAHRTCNGRAGHLSAPEKIRIHVGAVLKAQSNLEAA